MAELYAGCILQAGSMRDFTHQGQGCSAALSVGPSQAGTPQCSSPHFSQLLNAARAGAALPGCQGLCDRATPQCPGRTASVCPCWGCLPPKWGQMASSKVPRCLLGTAAGLMEQRCTSWWILCQPALPALLLSLLLVPTHPGSPTAPSEMETGV